MAEPGDGSRPVSVAPTEEDDFDLNTEELPEEDQTPAASGLDPEESFETEDEDLPEDVSCLAYYLFLDSADLQAVLIFHGSRLVFHVGSCIATAPRTTAIRRALIPTVCPLQEETSAQAKKEIAKREKERLRLQEKLKKENLEKLRKEQEDHAAADDVSSAGSS